MGENLLIVIGLSLLPGLGNIGGGLLAEYFRPSSRTLNFGLHAASGIILAVISVEVMPAALEQTSAWILALTFMAGGCAYLLLKTRIEHWQKGKSGGAGTGSWMVFVAVATDLVGDGLLIGAGTAVSNHLGLALALGQVLADIPEGFAVVSNFRDKGVHRAKRICISFSFLVPVVGSAIFAFFALRNLGATMKMAALVFIAGLYILAAVEDMLREAHESAEDSRWSAISFLAGFALFLILSGELG